MGINHTPVGQPMPQSLQSAGQRLTQALRAAGLRLTPQRRAICELLGASKEHPSAQQIYTALKPLYPSLSLATVYNTLDALVSLGAINALGPAGDAAVHYDADTEPHVNLACIRCHRIIDLESDHVAALENEVSHTSGYQILGASVTYYGLCPDCQQEVEKA